MDVNEIQSKQNSEWHSDKGPTIINWVIDLHTADGEAHNTNILGHCQISWMEIHLLQYLVCQLFIKWHISSDYSSLNYVVLIIIPQVYLREYFLMCLLSYIDTVTSKLRVLERSGTFMLCGRLKYVSLNVSASTVSINQFSFLLPLQ